jgi:hypothetical protein
MLIIQRDTLALKFHLKWQQLLASIIHCLTKTPLITYRYRYKRKKKQSFINVHLLLNAKYNTDFTCIVLQILINSPITFITYEYL